MSKQPDEHIARLQQDLENHLILLQQEADAYFKELQLQFATMSQEQLMDYQRFYDAYNAFYQQLGNPIAFAEENAADTEKEQLFAAAINITRDTTALFKRLSQKPETGDETYDPIRDRQQKFDAILQYHTKNYQEAVNSHNKKQSEKGSLHFGAYVLGTLVGAVAGAVVGGIIGLFAGMPFLGLGLGAGWGAIMGMVFVAKLLNKNSSAPIDQPIQNLCASTYGFTRHAALFFAPPKPAHTTHVMPNGAKVTYVF